MIPIGPYILSAYTFLSEDERTQYFVQKLPDFDKYILVRADGEGHWNGLISYGEMKALLNRDFKLYLSSTKKILDFVLDKIKEQGGRALFDGGCRLQIPSGKRCGFSLCITDKAREELIERNSNGYVGNFIDEEIEDMVLPEFKGKTRSFWQRVQMLHDTSINWNADGVTLSTTGQEVYNKMLQDSDD